MEYFIKELLFKAYSAGSEGRFLPVPCLMSMSRQGEGTVKKKNWNFFLNCWNDYPNWQAKLEHPREVLILEHLFGNKL